jgi:predicted unusual protein kinase regulating ubiquinone biosynthesis (AarF/ABC1/UbiB family)
MAEITAGRARRMLSVGGLTTSVGGSYLWQALKRPFQSASRQEATLLETHIRNARRVVERSKELRGAFTKLAQLLSMRHDLFPAEALEVLSTVQSSVPPMPWAKVRRVITAELGAPPEERFARFEHEAFAAASLGQVHRAELRAGRKPVVVKVQYPGVGDTVHQDLKNIRSLVRVFDSIARDVMRQDVDSGDVVRELEERLAEELDYRREADNLERFRTLLASDREVMIPRVHRTLSTGRVLTMDRLDGYPLQDIMAPGVDQELKDWVALKLFRLIWRQMFDFGVLHADPHPGNYLVTHHPKLGILDFGSVRVFEPAVRLGYLRTARGLLAGDEAAVGAAVTALGFVDPGDDPAPFIEILRIVCEPVLEDREWDPRDYDVVERGLRISQIKLSNRLYRAPGHQVFFLRALAGLDGYLKAFGTVRNWHRLFRDIVAAVPGDGRSMP